MTRNILTALANLALLAGILAWIWLGDWRYAASGLIALIALSTITSRLKPRTSPQMVDHDRPCIGDDGDHNGMHLHMSQGEGWKRLECARCDETLYDGENLSNGDVLAIARGHALTCPNHPTPETKP
ncbi:hypothetical protein [Nocardia cyriacigeorgica]|uniref:hypothetical protein n=1 Tax=Nocardia cyriacigeorgica TaxID=135487 RepID=UPI00245873AA|nr:hypothetical protein [Nocardia cyriacigeorgica]